MPLINAIGDFFFIDMQQAIPTVALEQLRLATREGVDGVFVMQTGARGVPFTLRTIVDAADMATALLLYNLYTTLIASDPVEIYWNSVNLSAGDQLYQVMNVRPIKICASGPNMGGINPPSYALCICDWDLVPVVVTT
ncbi:MAG TPA: hypothetical protein VHY20_16035 [Pirellulales bacterium]|jgi:hypothetical protein|nr:hypothetical protein [Pirellulales bacterium]